MNDYDNFSHPLFFLFFFAQNMPGLLFVLSGLLQIKEQTNRSSAGAFTTVQLFFLPIRYSAISKRSSAPPIVLHEREARPKDGSDIGNRSSCIFLFEGRLEQMD